MVGKEAEALADIDELLRELFALGEVTHDFMPPLEEPFLSFMTGPGSALLFLGLRRWPDSGNFNARLPATRWARVGGRRRASGACWRRRASARNRALPMTLLRGCTKGLS